MQTDTNSPLCILYSWQNRNHIQSNSQLLQNQISWILTYSLLERGKHTPLSHSTSRCHSVVLIGHTNITSYTIFIKASWLLHPKNAHFRHRLKEMPLTSKQILYFREESVIFELCKENSPVSQIYQIPTEHIGAPQFDLSRITTCS